MGMSMGKGERKGEGAGQSMGVAASHPKSTVTVTNAFLPLIIGFPSLKLVQWNFPWQGITNKPQDSSLSQLMMHAWPSIDELSIRNGTDY
jgi:hypothetical protein